MFLAFILSIQTCSETDLMSMPVVIVEMWEGRTHQQKETLIKGITKAFEEIGTKPDAVSVIIHDIAKANWGSGGQQASKK